MHEKFYHISFILLFMFLWELKVLKELEPYKTLQVRLSLNVYKLWFSQHVICVLWFKNYVELVQHEENRFEVQTIKG